MNGAFPATWRDEQKRQGTGVPCRNEEEQERKQREKTVDITDKARGLPWHRREVRRIPGSSPVYDEPWGQYGEGL